MLSCYRALSLLAPVVALPLLLAQLPATAAPARKSGPVKSAPAKPTPTAQRPTADIIPLPLNPVLPAAQRLCAAKAASGLGYTILRPATGPMPGEADYVLVNYIGYLASSGAVFDQGMQASFPVNGVIPGFSQGLQTLAKGAISRFCIPAALGYGPQGTGPIPANADLVFQVELVDYKTAAEIEALRKARAATQNSATPQE